MRPTANPLSPLRSAPAEEWQNGWPFRRTLLVAGLVALVATALSFFLSSQVGMVTATVLAVIGLLIRRGPLPLLIWTAAICLLSTACHYQLRTAPVGKMAGQRITVTGQVTDLSADPMITLTVTDRSPLPRGTRLALYCPEGSLALFDITTLEVDLKPLPARSGTWQRQGIFLYALPTGWRHEEGHPFIEGAVPLSHAPQPLRYRLRSVLRRYLPDERGALLSALCLGFRSDVSPWVSAVFRGSGLSHLLAVSGLHLSTLAAAVMALLRRVMGLRPAATLTALLVLLFVWMMNFTPSVCRAGVLCLIWLGGYFCRQRPDGFNSLGLALLILLPINPFLLWDAGFQLSFCATAGVLVASHRMPAPPVPRREDPRHKVLCRRAAYGLRNAVGIYWGATIATLPLICAYFGGFPITGIAANLLAITPAATALLLGWLGLFLCAVPFLAFAGQPLLLMAAKLMDFTTRVAEICSPTWAFIPIDRPWSCLAVTGICLLIAYAVIRRLPLRRWLPAVGFFVALTVTLGLLLTTIR